MTRVKPNINQIILILLIVSVALLFFSPFDETISKMKEQNLLLLLAAISVFELLFICGIVIMAYVIGHDIGWNPLKWRGHLRPVINKVTDDKYFWIGFWVNFAGALGTTAVFTIATLLLLPPQSWLLALVGSFDLLVTITLRYEVLQLKKKPQ